MVLHVIVVKIGRWDEIMGRVFYVMVDEVSHGFVPCGTHAGSEPISLVFHICTVIILCCASTIQLLSHIPVDFKVTHGQSR
jgi:hypothetical protein